MSQSTPNASSHIPYDLALYELAETRILREVMAATAHSSIDSTTVAVNAVHRLLAGTAWTMWDEAGVIVLTLIPVNARAAADEWGHGLARWVDTHAEADQIKRSNHGLTWTTVVINPGEIIQHILIERQAEQLRRSIPADAGHRCGTNGLDALIHDLASVAEPPRRNRRRLIAAAVVGVVLGFVGFRAADRAGAVTPSCSLHVLEERPGEIIWGYTPPDNVLRGIHLPDGRWVALTIGGRTVTPAVTEIAYPRASDRIVVADLIAQCGPHAPATTTSTSTTPPAPTTSTTSTTEPEATTTTAALSTGTTISSSTSWAPTTTTTEAAPPVITTLATTPLPPATVAIPPATTASVPPPASAAHPALVGGELPRTGRGLTLWYVGVFLTAVGIGFALESRRTRNSKES